MCYMMEGHFKLQFIIFIVYVTGFSKSFGPKLNVREEWVFEIESDKEGIPLKPLIITCEGDRNLEWHTEVPKEYYNISNNVTYGKHFSSIKVTEPVKEDTGYFTCSDDIGRNVSTYVYISDGEPFVSTHPHRRLNVEIGEPIYLDCRTTNPQIKVTVFKDSNEDVTSQFENDSFYRFQKIAESLQETGIYSCRENRLSTEITWLVNVEPRKTIQKPSIEKHRNSFHVVGVQFSLNCTIPVEQNDNPDIKWEIPNQYTDYTERKLKQENLPNVFAINELTIKSPTLSDSGDYKCIVKQGEHRASETIEIKIQDSVTPFVQFDRNITSHDVLFVKEREPFHWILYFRGFPNNLHYVFYDPFNRQLKDGRRKVSIKYVYEEGKLSLEIHNTTAEDFGKYRAKLATLTDVSDETGVVLIVNATPKVVFSKSPSLFSADQNVSLKTFILAFALTNVRPTVSWWLYNDCPTGMGSCDLSQGLLLNHTLNNEPDKPRNRFESTASFKPLSGMVVCEVENYFGKNSTQLHVKVSDKRKTFLFTVKTEAGITDVKNGPDKVIGVIEGDTVTINCFVLDFLYDDLNFSPKESSFKCNTSLSSGRCLQLSDATMQHDGPYECEATSKASGKKESLRFIMTVIEKKPPIILPTSNVSENGGIISVKASETFSIACFVEGRPTPTITWLKDRKNIQEIPHFVDNERVFLYEDNQLLEFKFAQREYEGVYTCHAENRIGTIEPYVSLIVQGVGLSPVHWTLISLAVLFILALCMIVVFLVARIRKESKLRNAIRMNQLYLFEKGNVGDLNKECTIDEQADLLPYDKAFEVERERIKLGKQLGAGAFGRVMQAEVDGLGQEGKTTRVAVKMCKDGADMAHLRALTLELKIMVHLGKHLNIVNLMGAHTADMGKGALWILVEYCKYGNLLKHIQKYKSRFVNQIDPDTGIIDIHRMTPLSHESFSPASLGRHNHNFVRTSNVDADGYLETRFHADSMRGKRPFTRNASVTSKAESSSGTSRPGMYVGNPHYAKVGFAPMQTPQSASPPSLMHPIRTQSENSGDHYVTATQLPSHPLSVHETSTSNPSSEVAYPIILNTDMTMVSSPPPFSPSSTTSEQSFFANPLECGGIPGISAPFTTTQLVCWAWQVANGMEYLTKRKVLHGDLAARNLLLAENNVVKISDFGLSRDIYKTDIYMKQGDEIMPIKWMAPEAIQQKLFSIQSDVWAFGITLWEMFTLGNTPYPGVPLNQDFPIALENGMRMENPKYSNEEMYDLMMNCWRLDPVARPNFSRIAEMLSEMLSPESRETYVAMNDILMRRNEQWMEFKEDYLTMVTSPDFQNLSAPTVDQSYISMQMIRETADRQEVPPSGYLDMKSMRSSPVPSENIFSPRPPSEASNKIFTFSGDQIPHSEEQRSPAETSNLLGSEEKGTLVQTSNELQNNNNINKLNSLNQQEHQPLYQNLEKVTLNNNQNTLEPYIEHSVGDDEEEEEEVEAKRNYMNIPKPGYNYVNTKDLA